MPSWIWWTCQPSCPDCCACLPRAASTGSRSTMTARASSSPAIPTTTMSCGPTTATWTGASDWVVYPASDGNYPADEAYFLRSILNTIRDALRIRQDWVEPADLAEWLAARCRQLAAGELVYIAHQLDFVGRSPS